MFSKIFTSAVLIMGLLAQVNAHAAVAPALGVAGTPVRNDVKRPNTANPCGAGVNVATALDSSTAVAAGAGGAINLSAINFNGGADGSRKVTAKVDATGTGKSFVAMTVSKNGDAAPATNAAQAIVANLPAGTKCTGGATKNKCLVQLVTSAGFGNCVAVSQGAAAAGAGAGAAAGGKKAKRAVGTRAARAMLAEIEARGEEAVNVVKRSVVNWIWA